jgi:hypothetical protein
MAVLVSHPEALKNFPIDAEIRVKLDENKIVEVLKFGTVGKPEATATLSEQSFIAPSCQVRIVSRGGTNDGLLLGSTKSWTYIASGQPDGILLFQAAKIAPRLWKLDIRPEENPVLYVDERIADAASWARSNPTFIASVLPHVISEVMRTILAIGSLPEDGWMADWIRWLETLMPGSTLPFNEPDEQQRQWIDDLVDSFALKHSLSDQVLSSLEAVQ